MSPNQRFAAILGLSVSAFFLLAETGIDPDLFWHLRVAEAIAESGVAPIPDSFSYFSAPAPWLPYSWLAEMLILQAMRGLGTAALVFVPLLCYAATLFFLGMTVVSRAGRTARAGIILITAALVLQPFIALRPATIAYPFLATSAWIVLDRKRDRARITALFAIVPLTALLANIHLFFLFPPLLLFARAGGEILDSRTNGYASSRTGLCTALVGVAALAAALLANPFGSGLTEVIAHYLWDDIMVASGIILEMQPFYRLGPTISLGVGFLIAWTLLGLLRERRLRGWADGFDLALTAVLLASIGRYVPLALLLLAPLAATYAPTPKLALPLALRRRLGALGAGTALGLAILAGQRWIAHPPEQTLLEYARARSRLPVSAALFVRDSLATPPGQGRLLNEMGWGGFLIYALAPDYRVMLDGRTQIYPQWVWNAAYVDASRVSRRHLLQTAGADVAVFPIGSEWARIVEEDMRWTRVYGDSVAGVWVRPHPKDGSRVALDASPTGS